VTPLSGRRVARPSAAVVLVVAAAALVLLTGLSGSGVAARAANLAQLAAAALSAAVCVRAGWRHRPGSRAPWYLLGAGCAAWALGQGMWTWFEEVADRALPYPSLADVGFAATYPLMAAGLVLLPRAVRLTARAVALVDGLLIAGSLLFVVWYVGPEGSMFEGALAEWRLSTAYLAGDVVLIVVALLILVRHRADIVAPVGLLAAGFAALAVADAGFAQLLDTGAYATGSLLDAGWVVGFSLIGLAASVAHSPRVPAGSTVRAPANLWLRVLPYSPLLLVAASQLRTEPSTELALLSFGIFVLVLVRQGITQVENRALAEMLAGQVKEVRSREQRYVLAARATQDAIWDLDVATGEIAWSENSPEVFGYSEAEWQSSLDWWADHVHPDDRDRVEASLDRAMTAGESDWAEEYRFLRADGTYAMVVDRGYLVRSDDGSPERMVGAIQDMTDKRLAEQELAHRATHDELTGLPNRRLLAEHLHLAMARSETSGGRVAALFVDVDHFKLVNDSYGHEAGDQVLIELAQRLRGSVRECDFVARFAGDEFVVLCPEVPGEIHAVGLAERVLGACEAPFDVGGRVAQLSVSVGIAIAGDPRGTSDLLHDADAALLEAKTQGRAQLAVFSRTLRTRAARRLEMQHALRTAIHRDGIDLVYQPIVDLVTGAPVGVEALARWSWEGEEISPSEFIPLAEESGLISALGARVLERAGADALEWSVRGIRLPISVNVSVLQLGPGLVEQVRRMLGRHGLPPGQLRLEVTETAIMADRARALEALVALRSLGVRLAIDDFGTGMSSLSYLSELPVDTVKIDRSFVEGLGRSEGNERIVGAVVALGGAVGFEVIAEGVETGAQARRLKELGCTRAQGFHFARPMGLAALLQWVTSATPAAV
jgi:diguanylate cyclase (GGDEF)-like protein/PAS domain S-box-containing protein